jgi:hypothetical protein
MTATTSLGSAHQPWFRDQLKDHQDERRQPWPHHPTEIMTSFTSHTRDLIRMLPGYGKLTLMMIGLSLGTATDLNASSEEDAKTVAALDTKYQAAVKSNDAATMDQILADDFVLVNGRGKVSQQSRAN